MSDALDISSFGTYGPRVIEPAREAPKKAPQTADKATEAQRELDRATLALSSARRTLRTYRRGVRSLAAGAAVTGTMTVAGVATAIGSNALGMDGTVTVLWLVLIGLPLMLANIGGMFIWHYMHRIKVQWRSRDGYLSGYVVDTKRYVDPAYEVEVAELKYGNALARLNQSG